MLYSTFKDTTNYLLSDYLMKTQKNFDTELSLNSGQVLYPNILLFTQTDDHFIFELIGCSKRYNGLKIKHHTCKNTNDYLYQFESEYNDCKRGKPIFFLNSKNVGLKRLKMSRLSDFKSLTERFGFIDRLTSELIMMDEHEGTLMEFGNDFKSCYIEDCLVINKSQEAYRVKDILCMGIVSKNHLKDDYINELTQKLIDNPTSTDDLFGIHFCDREIVHNMLLAGQFANMFLVPGIHETTIGEFLNRNPSFIKSALSHQDFLYEKEFPWLEGNDFTDEKFINPDLMLKRIDGFYDICDLKTPKLNKNSLTKGEHKRRRFMDYVGEGIAQLANYEEYFTFSKNKIYADLEFGVKVHNPILYLIVGNYENMKKQEVKEACRHLKNQYRIIDFDTLHALFLNSIKNKK